MCLSSVPKSTRSGTDGLSGGEGRKTGRRNRETINKTEGLYDSNKEKSSKMVYEVSTKGLDYTDERVSKSTINVPTESFRQNS